jgi:hypothetical protein
MAFDTENEEGTVIKKLILLLLISSFLAVSCGGKDKVKPSEDALLTGDALQAINLLKDAYEKKDVSVMESIAVEDLLDEIKKELFFDEAQITFSTPRLVRISDTVVKVSQNWQSEWTINGKKANSRGVSKMVYGRDAARLIKIEGDNPFRIPILTGAY